MNSGIEEIIVGVVGVLQFEVLEYRLLNEYNVEIRMQQLPYRQVRWIEMNKFDPDTFHLTMDSIIAVDHQNQPVLMFQNEWSKDRVEERNPGVSLNEIAKRSLI